MTTALIVGVLSGLGGLVLAIGVIAWLARTTIGRGDELVDRADKQAAKVVELADVTRLYNAAAAQFKTTNAGYTDYRLRAEAQRKALHDEIDSLEAELAELYAASPGRVADRIADRMRRLREKARDRTDPGDPGPARVPDRGASTGEADPGGGSR